MKTSRQLSILAGMLICWLPFTPAQPQSLGDRLPPVRGGLSERYDVSGLVTGMPCSAAVAAVQQLIPSKRIQQRTDNLKGAGVWIRNFESGHDVRTQEGTYFEKFYVECSGFGSGNIVLSVRRSLHYGSNNQVNIDDLTRAMRARYGNEHKSFGRNIVVYIYDEKGGSSRAHCGDFWVSSHTATSPALIPGLTDPNRLPHCGFFRMTMMWPGIDNSRTKQIDIYAADFIRYRIAAKIDREFEKNLRDRLIKERPTGPTPKP